MSSLENLPVHLLGNGAPVNCEVTLTDLCVTGHIPVELDGMFLRNGANPISGWSDHPFLGDGMVHGVRLCDGEAAWYKNRYVQTPFISNPGRTVIDMGASLTDMTQSKANTNVIAHAGQLLALEEGHFPYALAEDLSTLGPTSFDGALTGPFTAHPKKCPVTGELIAFGYSMLEPYLTYLRVSASGRLVQKENITVGGPTMMHDFNVTRNFVIFMDLPAVFDINLAIRGEMPIVWGPNYPARLGVLPRDGNDSNVVWYEIDPCYVFHSMNAYEDGSNIVIDVVRLDHIWRDGPTDFPTPLLYRWTIDTVNGRVFQEQVDDMPAEFPRVADTVVGLPYRFGYLAAVPSNDAFKNPALCDGMLLKYDRVSGVRTSLQLGKGRMPGEAVFVPALGGANEDDGYLVTYVYDAATDSSSMLILDAATMCDEPVASIQLPRVPFGFHGNWVDTHPTI